MQIGTDVSIMAGLTTLFGGATDATTSGDSAGGGFGPSSLLSLGSGASSDSSSDLYTNLAGLGVQLNTQLPPTISEEQAKREKEAIEYATVLRANGLYDDSRKVLDELLAENPTNGVAVHALGAIELELGEYEKAESLFQKAHYLTPQYGFDSDAANARTLQRDDDYVLDQARRMVAQPDSTDQGTRLLVTLTRRSPSNAEARVVLAETLINSGDATNGLTQYQLAISTANDSQLKLIESKLEVLLKRAPKAAYLHNLIGQTQLKLGKNEEAAANLSRASELGNGDPLYLADEALAQVALGRDALKLNRITDAMGFFRAAQSLDMFGTEVKLGMAEGLAARGSWRFRMGDASSAIDDFKLAVSKLGALEADELKTKIAQGLYNAGTRLERKRIAEGGEVGKEVVAFQAAYDLDPDNLTYTRKLAETRSALGDEYLAEGEYKDAAYAYKAAYELRPREDSYKQAAIDAFVAYGDARAEIYDHHEAIKAYQEAYDLDKTNETSKSKLAEALNTRGVWYRSLGDDFYSDAAADFLAALDLYPDDEGYQGNYDSVV